MAIYSLKTTILFLVLLVPHLANPKFEDVWKTISPHIETNSDFNKHADKIKNTLKNASLFVSYPVEKYLGAGTGGVVFSVKSENPKLVAKIIIDDNFRFPYCRDNQVLKKLEDDGVNYVNKLVTSETYTGYLSAAEKTVSASNFFYSCVLILEKADTDLKIGKLFERNSISNWPVLLRFFGKLIQSFAEINFKGKILHGDIKPENIMVKISKKGTPPELDIEPMVIDFDLNLENPREEYMTHHQLRFSFDYRPREMFYATFIPNIDSTTAWKKNWRKYLYSGEFIEDSYALGITIIEVLASQSGNVDQISKEYTNLLALAKQMAGSAGYIQDKIYISDRNRNGLKPSRPNTKIVLGKFLDIIRACEKCKDSNLTKQFIVDAQKSLDEMNKKLICI